MKRCAMRLFVLGIPLALGACRHQAPNAATVRAEAQARDSQSTPTTQPLVTASTSTSTTAAPATPALNEKRFRAAWLEPYSLSIGRGPAGNSSPVPTSAELRKMILAMKSLGVETLVVAYAEALNCFIYRPTLPIRFQAWDKNSNGVVTSVTVDSANPAQRCPVLGNANFFDALFEIARGAGMKIVLGLSRTGDLHLLNDIENSLLGRSGSVVFPGLDLNARLGTAVYYTKIMAQDLFVQYGTRYPDVFDGWYLAHETSCLDVGMNYYGPVATFLKSLSPGKRVMVSPTIDSRICVSTRSYLDWVDSYKGVVDTYSYQDTVGAGSLWVNGTVLNYYDDLARAQRTYEIIRSGRLNQLALTHAQTGTELGLNVEAWEMDGNCEAGFPGGGVLPSQKYGCPYPGKWASLRSRLEGYWPYTHNLMLNEAFLVLDYGIENLGLSKSVDRARAAELTTQYTGFLRN